MDILDQFVDNFNENQKRTDRHPLTCDGSDVNCGSGPNSDRALIATREGLKCPCGKYKQDIPFIPDRHGN